MISQVEKFHTIFEHVKATGLCDDGVYMQSIGKKMVRVVSLSTGRRIAVMLGDKWLMEAVHANGQVTFPIGHPDGLDLLYADVLKLPI